MPQETFSDPNSLLGASSKATAQVEGSFTQSFNCDKSLQKDAEFRTVGTSILNTSSGNMPSSVARSSNFSGGMEEPNLTVLQNSGTLNSSSRASHVPPNINSAVPKGRQLGRDPNAIVQSKPIMAESVISSLHKSDSSPFFPMDFSFMAQKSHLVQKTSPVLKRKQWQGGSPITPEAESQKHHGLVFNDISNKLLASNAIHKKPRLDIKQDTILGQGIIRKLTQSSDQLQGCTLQPQAPIHHCNSQTQEKKTISQVQKHDKMKGKQVQQEQRLNQKQGMFQVPAALHRHDGGLCSLRLTHYMHHLRHRPPDNSIGYWRKFVTEYYAPSAQKRWCFSLCDNAGFHALDLFPSAAMGAWQCNICSSNSRKGFEAFFEILPRIYKLTFDSGVIDEILFLDRPQERRFHSGLTMVECEKAVQEIVYEQLRVVREGKLRVVFSQGLKILSWQFCVRNHEEFVPRNLVVSQVNELVHAVEKYQSTIDSNEVATHDSQPAYNLVMEAMHELARYSDSELILDTGFSSGFIRHLQIADSVNNMKDLRPFSFENKIGPIESLKEYRLGNTQAKLQKDDLQERKRKSGKGLSIACHNLMADRNDCSDGTNGQSSVEATLAMWNSLNSNLSKEKLSHSDSSFEQTVSATSLQGPANLILEPSQKLPGAAELTSSYTGLGFLQEIIDSCKGNSRGDAEKVNYKVSQGEGSGK